MWQVSILGYRVPDEFPWETTLLTDHYPVAMELVGVDHWCDVPHQTYQLSEDQAARLVAVMGYDFPADVKEWELRVQRLYAR